MQPQSRPTAQSTQNTAPKTQTRTTIAIAMGDGIGPEIMRATLAILEKADVPLNFEEIKIGEAVYNQGISAGIEDAAWDILRQHKVFLKAPITTPSGKGYKSLNVTARKMLGLYANIRPCISYAPYLKSLHDKMDVVIVRENEEDTYAGIEYRISDEVMQCLKLISRPGCEKIIRYAFEYARTHKRKKVTCMSKDNIMKMTDGLFHSVFDEIAKEYPDIENNHMIIDIGAARLAARPNDFDVIVTENLYGDIISDIAAEVSGSIGIAPSSNIGPDVAMFEAVHGSAPDIAGKNIANPSGLLLASVLMLNHLGLYEHAEKIHNAWLKTIEDGLHTGDIYKEGLSKEKLSTSEFTLAVIERLGAKPSLMTPVSYQKQTQSEIVTSQPVKTHEPITTSKIMVGVDVYLQWNSHNRDANALAHLLKPALGDDFELAMISNRGTKVWPNGLPETFCTDSWRCRFMRKNKEAQLNHRMITRLLDRITLQGLDFVKIEQLNEFNQEKGYTLGQGQ
jgi:isocitrate dehydrogenase